MKDGQSEKEKLWATTPVSNLVRYVPSGKYFARVRVGGKLIRHSLKTKVMSVAQLRLHDLIKEERAKLETNTALAGGKMTVGDAIKIYLERVNSSPALKPSAKRYRDYCVVALKKTWLQLEILDLRKVSERECLDWAEKFSNKYAASFYNNTVGTLREILKVGIKAGARYSNPALAIKKAKVRHSPPKLPEQDQFFRVVEEVRKSGAGQANHCGDLIEFLAFGGFRKGEAATVLRQHVNFRRSEIRVVGDPVHKTKNSEERTVPMIPEMKSLLERIWNERPSESPDSPVMKVKECQKSLDRACKIVGIPRFTHHDLRHLFATRCIESGVDIPTVSRWLGHKDGGALAMKVYGHLRDQHSTAMAQKVSFAVPNVKKSAKKKKRSAKKTKTINTPSPANHSIQQEQLSEQKL